MTGTIALHFDKGDGSPYTHTNSLIATTAKSDWFGRTEQVVIGASIRVISTHTQMTEDYVYTQDEFAYNASTATGFGDHVWFQETSFNVYYYPVLGETACPNDNPPCTEDEELPLFVVLSGPNTQGMT